MRTRAPAHTLVPPREVLVPLSALTPNPKNYNQHPISQLKKLGASIRRHGQVAAILARAENHMIIAGHGVYEAMRQEGLNEARVWLWDVDQDTADRYMVADNELARLSNPDEDALRHLLEGIPTDELFPLGFSAEEAAELLAEREDPDLVIKEIDTGDVLDTFWITVRGPLKDQAVALQRLQSSLIDLPDTRVELGTTPG